MRSGAEVDSKIKQHVDEIDTTLLTLLYRRIEVSRKLEEGDEMINGLTNLFWRCGLDHRARAQDAQNKR